MLPGQECAVMVGMTSTGWAYWKRFVLFLLTGFLDDLSENLNLISKVVSKVRVIQIIMLHPIPRRNLNKPLNVLRTIMLASDTICPDFSWKLTVVIFSNASLHFLPLLVLS